MATAESLSAGLCNAIACARMEGSRRGVGTAELAAVLAGGACDVMLPQVQYLPVTSPNDSMELSLDIGSPLEAHQPVFIEPID